jgi:hypothetical protein
MQTEIRFTCPECGQHYTAEANWEGSQMTCSACQAQFTVSGLSVLTADPEPPVTATPFPRVRVQPGTPGQLRTKGTCPWMGTLCGLLTPPALAIIAFLCGLPRIFLGRPGMLLGIVVSGVGIACLTNRFSKWYLATWGSDAFEYYRKSASVAFLLVPGVAVFIFMLGAEEGAGLVLFPLTLGLYFFSILLAAPWLAGIKWARWRE